MVDPIEGPLNDDDALESIFCNFLALPQESCLILDIRPQEDFHSAHVAHSYHLHPLTRLKSRYSYLPPRDVAFLVLADAAQAVEAREALANNSAAQLVFLSSCPIANGSSARDTFCKQEFFRRVAGKGLLRTSNSHVERLSSVDDLPTLLFRPSNAVRRVIQTYESQAQAQTGSRQLRKVLDLGCGAGRDLAWILHRSRTVTDTHTNNAVKWRGVGLDNWKAALTRAEQLMHDLYLDDAASTQQAQESQGQDQAASTSASAIAGCEALVWAKCNDRGFLEALVGTGKGKSVSPAPTSDEERKAVDLLQRLGLGFMLELPSHNLDVEVDERYDLILSIRFLPRELLSRIHKTVTMGGKVLLSHFVVLTEEEQAAAKIQHPEAILDYDSPPPQGRLQPGEAENLIESWNRDSQSRNHYKWIIAENFVEPIEDGRIIRSVVLKKVPA